MVRQLSERFEANVEGPLGLSLLVFRSRGYLKFRGVNRAKGFS